MCMLKWKLVILAACVIVCHLHLPLVVVAESSSQSPSSPSALADDSIAYINLLEEENGVKVLVNEDSFQQALEEGAIALHGSVHQPQLMLTLIYSASCPHCSPLVTNMEAAIPLVESYLNDPIRQAYFQQRPKPSFGKMDGSLLDDPSLLQRMGIVAYPTLLFVSNFVLMEHGSHNNHEHVDVDDDPQMKMKILFLDYMGLYGTPQDIADTVLMFYYRMVVAPRHFYKDVVHVLPIPLATLEQAQMFVQQHGQKFLRQASSLNLSPELSEHEQDYITWLLEPAHDMDQDALLVFVQCRDPNKVVDENAAMLTMFDEMSSLLSSRPDRAFFSIEDCSPEQLDARDVIAYRLPPEAAMVTASHPSAYNESSSSIDMDWNEFPHVSLMATTISSPSATDLKTFVVQQATPSVLWFDRQSTAPIVFHKSRKVHAVLFIDFHQQFLQGDNEYHQNYNQNVSDQDLHQQQLIRQFRKMCRHHQDQHKKQEDDMACLIVPSTETRILTTFGIDLWARWDAMITRDPSKVQATTERNEASVTSRVQQLDDTLPVLLITDQRIAGTTLRYYLEPPNILSQSTAIYDFVKDFWLKRLKPELSSSRTNIGSTSKKSAKRNNPSSHALTGQTFEAEFLVNGRHQHRLVLFYAPTCGHCKRFFLVWKQLTELIKYIEWDSFLTLYKMDVTENEIDYPAEWNMSMYWLPDLYYFPPSDAAEEDTEVDKLRERPIRYDREDARGDGVGRLNHPLEVVEWLLDVGGFDEFALLKLLDTEDADRKVVTADRTVKEELKAE